MALVPALARCLRACQLGRMIRFLFALLALAIATPAASQAPQTLDEQLELFLEWFPGRYDNGLQVERQEAAGLPEDQRNYHRHSIFRRVDLPRFGEITFYAEQYRNHDPAEVYRQRIYVITRDYEEQAIRLRVYVPHEPEKLLGAYRDLSLLEGFDPEMTRNWAGCDLLWRWEGDQFRGELKPGACRFKSEAYGEVVLEEYLILREDEIVFADRGLSPAGEYLFGMRGEEPTLAKRVRPFLCFSWEDGSYPHFERWTHDQLGGFEMPFMDSHLSGQLRLSEDGEVLRLSVDRIGRYSPPLGASAAGSVDEVFVFFDGWMNVGCGHVSDRLYEDGGGEAPTP